MNNKDFQETEAILRAAGFTFEPVADCSTPACLWCASLQLPAAA